MSTYTFNPLGSAWTFEYRYLNLILCLQPLLSEFIDILGHTVYYASFSCLMNVYVGFTDFFFREYW